MPSSYINTILTATFAYWFGLFLVRIVGRKTVSQMTFFDFVLGVSIGTMTANVALGPNRVLAGIALIVFAAMTLLSDYLHIGSFQARKLINSEPVVVIKNGKIIDGNMRRVKYSVEDLNMQLRQKNVFNISDVEFALVETNGKLSVLPKSQKQPLTPSDLSLSTGYKGLTKDIVIDGSIIEENLQDARLDEQWLTATLRKQGINDVGEVFYAGLDTSGNLYVSEKRKPQERHGEYGLE